jgi:hypothetical protein
MMKIPRSEETKVSIEDAVSPKHDDLGVNYVLANPIARCQISAHGGAV